MTTPAPGIRIRALSSRSPFYRAGLRKGDRIAAINGAPVRDELDFRFHAAAASQSVAFLRHGRQGIVSVSRRAGVVPGIDFSEKPIRRCSNRCIFCFIDQMPPGLRGSLYVKDEDLTHSFLSGNYVTLTNATSRDFDRLAAIGLSPLFVSVHATDPAVRKHLLGVSNAPPVMGQLRLLGKKNISFHTQIVVCPGYNDGAVLERTVRDLFSLGRRLLSIAVVPVGLTRFRRFPLRPVDRATAGAVADTVSRLSDADRRRTGVRRLFLADEFFLGAHRPIPPRSYYEDFPQIENGVGLVRLLMETWSRARRSISGKRRALKRKKNLLLVTSISAARFLRAIAAQAERVRPGVSITVMPVENRFFGASVTVAGLLTARDVLRDVRAAPAADRVIVPAVMFNHAGYTLDGYSLPRISRESGRRFSALTSVDELLRI